MTLEKPAGTASKLGTYELLKEHPGIGVGATWVARSAGDAGDGGDGPRLFSLIRVHRHLAKKPETAEALVTDTQAATGFRHPNAAALIEVGNEAGELYVVSEHHDGETLAALVTTAGAAGLGQPVVLRIALDVLAALAAAHAEDPPLAHGELGPQHVLVGDDGVTRVTGLASARALSRVVPPIGARNHDRLSYAAPERVKGLSSPTPPPADARADVFSVGVILWEALARQRLFTSKIEAAIVQKVLTAPIAALGTLPGITVAAPLAQAVHDALERDPAKRTQTAGALRAQIEALGADAVATPQQVAAEVDRLVGKAVATRKTDVRAEITRRANKGSQTIPPPAQPRPGGGPSSPRKATLLGIAAMKPGAVAPVPAPAAASHEPAHDASSLPRPPPVPTSAASPRPAEVKPQPPIGRPPAESLNLEEIEMPDSIEPPPVPVLGPSMGETLKPLAQLVGTPVVGATRGVTLLMGSEALPPPPPVNDKPAAKPPAAKPASAPASTPKPASAQALLEAASGGKTAPTPASDGPSQRSKNGVAVEKVGPGSTLGRYEILMPVARGGMASVWAAKLPGSRGFQKIFAIKTMLPDVSDDPEFESMFLDEGRVAARIRHPNVVEIIDLGEQDDVLYLVMEWVEGENLGALVKAARALGGVPMPIILRIASQVCAGLHAAHELRDDDGNLLDLVHRDISPANVLVCTSGFVKIVDFGIAKSKGRLHVTRVGGMVKGKTPYLSPEQLGQQPVDRRSDIFSFGVLLYVLATGLHPFRGETDGKTIENIALREPVPLRAIAAGTPPEFEAIVLKAIAKDPKDRFTTAAEMHRAVDQVAATLGLTTTEEDVAAFVRKSLGETLSKRAQELRAAVERAEGRPPAEPPVSAAAAAAPVSGVSAIPAVPAAAEPGPISEAATAIVPPVAAAPEPASTEAAAPSAPRPLPKAPALKPLVPAKPVEPVAALPKVILGDVKEPPGAIDEEISFESASGMPEASALAPKDPAGAELPRPKQPEAVTLPEIPPPPLELTAGLDEAARSPAPLFAMPPPPPEAPPGDDPTSRPVTRSDDEAPLVVEGVARKRKPVAMIAVGAVLGLCVVLGGVALLTGGKDAGTKPATPVGATIATPPPPPPATPTPPPQPTPTAADTAQAAPPATPAETATAEATAADTAAPVPPRSGKGPLRTTPGKPPPGKIKIKKPYNPGTL